jgi:hypothetical protein
MEKFSCLYVHQAAMEFTNTVAMSNVNFPNIFGEVIKIS